MSTTNRRSVMMLYSDKLDPVGHAVRIVLAEKDINVEIKYIDAGDPPVELRELNPYTDTDTLTLADRDLVLYDIQVIMEYLDERFPHPPLMPVDPVARATSRQLCFRVRRDIYVPLGQLQEGNEIASANARKTIRDNLTAIAGAFDQKPYFMSDEYSLVDCCLAPVLWRLPQLGIKLPAAAKPLQKYAERLFARPGFRKSLSDAERELQS